MLNVLKQAMVLCSIVLGVFVSDGMSSSLMENDLKQALRESPAPKFTSERSEVANLSIYRALQFSLERIENDGGKLFTEEDRKFVGALLAVSRSKNAQPFTDSLLNLADGQDLAPFVTRSLSGSQEIKIFRGRLADVNSSALNRDISFVEDMWLSMEQAKRQLELDKSKGMYVGYKFLSDRQISIMSMVIGVLVGFAFFRLASVFIKS